MATSTEVISRDQDTGYCFPTLCGDSNSVGIEEKRINEHERAPEVSTGIIEGDADSIAVAVSGGGMRSFACACGQVRAMRDSGLWKDVSYLSASSGGAWFALAYFCADVVEEDTLLGDVVLPEDLRLDTIGKVAGAPDCLRKAATVAVGAECNHRLFRNLLMHPRRAVLSALESVLNETLFAPYSNREKSPPRKETKPFVIVGAALLGPWSAVPFPENDRQYRSLEISPVAVGVPEISHDVHYSKKSRHDVGGFTDTQKFFTQKARSKHDTVEKDDQAFIKNASRIAALCGCAHADFVCSHQDPGLHLAQVFSRMLTAPLLPYNNDEQFVFGDGGIIDNLNLIPLVRRDHIKKIICLCNFETPLNDAWNPYRRPAPYYDQGSCLDIDASLASYFGHNVVPDSDKVGYFLARNHVFESEAFPILINRLQLAQRAGDGAVASVDVTTITNDWAGVQGGRTKRLIVIYLGRCPAWEAKLTDPELSKLLVPTPPGVKDGRQVIDSTKLVQNKTRFDHFPHMAASGPFAPSFDLASVDLLANFCGWVMKENADHIRELLDESPSKYEQTSDHKKILASSSKLAPHPRKAAPDLETASDPAHTIQSIRCRRCDPTRNANVTNLTALDQALDAIADGR